MVLCGLCYSHSPSKRHSVVASTQASSHEALSATRRLQAGPDPIGDPGGVVTLR